MDYDYEAELDKLYQTQNLDSYYTTTDTSMWASPAYTITWLALLVLMLAGLWKTFSKAGQPGWAAIIPIYNAYIQLKIVGLSGWLLLLYLVPIANIVLAIVVAVKMAKVFGKGGAFGFFLLFLFGFIGYPILGFGKARYTKPKTA